MARFVVLTHDHPFLHWDLLLEAGEVCRAWRLLEEPGNGRIVPAEVLPDHRLHYLTYEGPVSGGRGSVARWDGGTFEWVSDKEGRVVVELRGARIRGRCELSVERGKWQAAFE